ncbi:hypothetical protein LQR31_20155 [Chromobacterium vaccinii]|uniref:hypothetical protein n=1 Tax=Chromobacterium vaccinii TaxID=1108595 RepID=UPI001E407E7C|nr:hypothetical protein [Chromobacterium vaccinii]MCD4486788.1 hypothetical protein [Chromobacterium vaccinii]
MKIQATSISASIADAEYDDLAYIYARGRDGYVFSLSRQPDSPHIEVIVQDQINCKTGEVQAKLSATSLQVVVPEYVAEKLSGESEYEVVFAEPGIDNHQTHEALCAIFLGVGFYENAL